MVHNLNNKRPTVSHYATSKMFLVQEEREDVISG